MCASVTEIGRLNGVTSNIQIQCENAIKKIGSTPFTADVVLSGAYKFAGATPTELSYISRVNSNIQTQLNGCLRDNNTTALTGLLCYQIQQIINSLWRVRHLQKYHTYMV